MTTDSDLEELRAELEQLRAENTRLRDELERRSDNACALEAAGDPVVHELQVQRRDLEAENARLRATIARVEKLSLKWMDYVVLQTGEGIPDCADDLERALRGEL